MPLCQLDLFDEKSLDKRQCYRIVGKYAVKEIRDWQNALSIVLVKESDFITGIFDVDRIIIEENELLKMGYTVIIPEKSYQTTSFQVLPTGKKRHRLHARTRKTRDNLIIEYIKL